MKAAGKVAQLANQRLSRQQKKGGGTAVHYAFGTALGALYGIARELSPGTLQSIHPVLAGVGYGSAVFVGADEFAVPAWGLSESQKTRPSRPTPTVSLRMLSTVSLESWSGKQYVFIFESGQ
jgi:putative membrane protein